MKTENIQTSHISDAIENHQITSSDLINMTFIAKIENKQQQQQKLLRRRVASLTDLKPFLKGVRIFYI